MKFYVPKIKISILKGIYFIKIYINFFQNEYRHPLLFGRQIIKNIQISVPKWNFLYQKWKFHNLKGINILNWTKILLKIANLGEKVVKNDHFWGDPCSRDIFRDFLTKRKFCVPKWNFGFITYYSILFVLSEPNKTGPGSLGCDFAHPQKLWVGNAPEPLFITYLYCANRIILYNVFILKFICMFLFRCIDLIISLTQNRW